MNGCQTLRKLAPRLYDLYSRLRVARRLSFLVWGLDGRRCPSPESVDRHEEIPMDPQLLHNIGGPSRSRCEIHLDLNRGEIAIEGAGPDFRTRINDLAGPGGLIIYCDGVREILLTIGRRGDDPYVSPNRNHFRTWNLSDDGRRQANQLPNPNVGGSTRQLPPQNEDFGFDRGAQSLVELNRRYHALMAQGELPRDYDWWRANLADCFRLRRP